MHAFGDHDVEALRLGVIADFTEQQRCSLFISSWRLAFEVVLELCLLALELARAVAQVLLGLGALVGRHGRDVFL